MSTNWWNLQSSNPMYYIWSSLKVVVSSTGFPLSSWLKPNQVIGLGGQHELGRGPSHKIFTMYDDEAQLITTSCGKIRHQEETAWPRVLEVEGWSTKGVGGSNHQVKTFFFFFSRKGSFRKLHSKPEEPISQWGDGRIQGGWRVKTKMKKRWWFEKGFQSQNL